MLSRQEGEPRLHMRMEQQKAYFDICQISFDYFLYLTPSVLFSYVALCLVNTTRRSMRDLDDHDAKYTTPRRARGTAQRSTCRATTAVCCGLRWDLDHSWMSMTMCRWVDRTRNVREKRDNRYRYLSMMKCLDNVPHAACHPAQPPDFTPHETHQNYTGRVPSAP